MCTMPSVDLQSQAAQSLLPSTATLKGLWFVSHAVFLQLKTVTGAVYTQDHKFNAGELLFGLQHPLYSVHK